MKRFLPIVILVAALLLDALLCGFTGGAILVSSGTAFYRGWSGVPFGSQSGEIAAAAPTYLPLPTYTLLPTYTAYPTHTPAAALELPAPISGGDLMPTPGLFPTPELTNQTITYEVQEGDTIESIAEDFQLNPLDIILANDLDADAPEIAAGDLLIIPVIMPTVTPQPGPSNPGAYPVPSLPATYP